MRCFIKLRVCLFVCLFIWHSKKYQQHYQLQRFSGSKYNGKNVLQTVNPKHAKLQHHRLQQPTTLPDGKKYYPLDVSTPHVEVICKTEDWNSSTRVPKTFIATLRTPEVENENGVFFGLTRKEVEDKIGKILDEAEIAHRLQVEFCLVGDGIKKYIRDKYDEIDRLDVGYRVEVRILCESEKMAVLAQVVLHQAKSLENRWQVSLSRDTTRAIYVQVDIKTIIAYLFCGVEESEAVEGGVNNVAVVLHADAISHHPKTTMVTLKFFSLDGARIFRGKSRISEVLPAIVAVGSDSQVREYFREVILELKKFILSGYLKVAGGKDMEKTFVFGFANTIFCIFDRAVLPCAVGVCSPMAQSAIGYTVCRNIILQKYKI